MLQLLALMSKAMDNETILENIKEAITEWQITKDEDTFNSVIFHCHLLFIKKVTNGKSTAEFVADVENVDKFMNVFKSKN